MRTIKLGETLPTDGEWVVVSVTMAATHRHPEANMTEILIERKGLPRRHNP